MDGHVNFSNSPEIHQTSMMNETWTVQSSAESVPFERDIWHWILSILLFITAIITLLGNGTVMITFFMDKRLLRSHFNIFLFNLTITDIAVSITAIPLFGVSYFTGSWPEVLGTHMCAVWIFCDWFMTFASVYTLVAISVDRYWAVCWSHHYRAHNTRRRTLFMVAIVWIVVLVIWLPSFILDRIHSYQVQSQNVHGICMWSVEHNWNLAIFMSICGNHIPTVIIIFTYIRVFILMRRSHVLAKPELRQSRDDTTMNTTSGITIDSYRSSDSACLSQIPMKTLNGKHEPPVANEIMETRFSDIRIIVTQDDEVRELSESNVSTDNQIVVTGDVGVEIPSYSTNHIQRNSDERFPSKHNSDPTELQPFMNLSLSQEKSQSTQSLEIPRIEFPNIERLKERPRSYTDGIGIARMFHKRTAEAHAPDKRRCKSGPCETIRVSNVSQGNRTSRARANQASWQRKDYKLFVRVSYIMLAFLVCWTPFHIVFDLMLADINVNDHWYTFSALMCYLNSTINPILYALGNPKMKAAFKNTLACVNCKCGKRTDRKK